MTYAVGQGCADVPHVAVGCSPPKNSLCLRSGTRGGGGCLLLNGLSLCIFAFDLALDDGVLQELDEGILLDVKALRLDRRLHARAELRSGEYLSVESKDTKTPLQGGRRATLSAHDTVRQSAERIPCYGQNPRNLCRKILVFTRLLRVGLS